MGCTLSYLAGSAIEIFCSNLAAPQLKSSLSSDILDKSYKIDIVKGDECLDLGGGENFLPNLYRERRKIVCACH